MSKRAFKYRLYPTEEQIPALNQAYGHTRYVWNHCVEQFQQRQEPLSVKALRELHPFLAEVSAASLQQKQRDFFETKKQFLNKNRKKRIRAPKFKKKGAGGNFRLPYPKFSLASGQIRLEKIGKVAYVEDRPLPSGTKILSVTVSRNPANQHFISILVEYDIPKKAKTGSVVGCDLGLKSFVVTSENEVFEPQQSYRKNQAELKKAQRHLSRKQKGSKRRNKQRQKVAKIHQKTANQRHHSVHQVTTHLVNHYDTIVVEDLNVQGMAQNRKLAKSLYDASFRLFRTQLEYKCEWYGKKLVVADRFFASTKICSGCGHRKAVMGLSERIFTCEKCALSLDRDWNAALNLKKWAV
jgi:putative transposase